MELWEQREGGKKVRSGLAFADGVLVSVSPIVKEALFARGACGVWSSEREWNLEALDDIEELRPPSCCAIQEQVVCSSDSDSILSRMPASVQNLLVEVQRLQLHRVPEASRTRRTVLGTILSAREGASNLLGFEGRLICLQDNVTQRVGVVYPEVIVIGAG